MIPQAALDHFSRIGLECGLRLLQGFRLHDTDEGHVERLLALAGVVAGHWLDIGCGFGEFARLARRPALRFTLLNYNAFQLTHAPENMPRVRADMNDLPFGAGSFDGAMFLYSLCHADDPLRALAEAARVVRPGGHLVVYDYTGADCGTWGELYARFYEMAELEGLARACGWRMQAVEYPHGREMMFDQHPSFADLRATLWRAARD